jgi:hypothetical protein
MKCPQCNSENVDGKNFCSDCGALLTPQFITVIRAQVEEYIKEHFNEQELVDVTTTEAIAERFVRWGKWFLIPVTILLTLLGLILGVIGIRDIVDVHKAAQQAITESNGATKNAADAKIKAQEAETKAGEAINAIADATSKMEAQLASAKKLSDNVSGLEQRTAGQIANTNKRIEGRVSDLDKSIETTNKAIAEQQSKLLSTNELVTAMFSKGQVEYFQATGTNATNFVVVPMPTAQGSTQKGAVVCLLLKSAPILQTVQINFRIFVQPKSSYFPRANVITFFWGDPAENLKQYPIEVSYVPDPTYKGVVYSKLSVKDGHIFADNEQVQ